MRAVDRDNVTRLLQQLARDASTEGLIVFVADTSGMLQTCRAVLTLDRDGDDEAKAWLHTACAAREIAYGQLLHEASKIVQLFQADTGDGDYYAVLGLSPDATEDEVKRSYRQLSRRYHPDTAPTAGAAGTDRFIRITRAYHAIIAGEEPAPPAIPFSPAASSPPIRKGGQRRRLFGPRVPLRAVVGLALLAGIVVAACLVVSEVYSRRVMLKTLHDGGVAFVPPKAQKTVREEPAALTFAEKLRRTREAEAVAAKKDERGKTIVAAASTQPDPTASARPTPVASRQPNPVASAQPSLAQSSRPTPAVISTAGRDLKPATEHPPQGKARFLASHRNDREGASSQPTPTPSSRPTPAVISTAGRDLKPAMEKSQATKATPVIKPVPATDTTPILTATKPPPPSAPAQPPHTEAQLQQQLNRFLTAYCQAYGARNLTKFQQFFTPKATENGTPVSDLMPTYSKLFASTKGLSLRISTLKWHQPAAGRIALNGRFEIDLDYRDADAVHGAGKIDFQLAYDDTSLKVQKMTYSFDQ